ncbi:unnamed protein product [Dicrocoelium dendriticum]|nr:unnamed protein product [Dicrocoelium dendriticum]
MRLFRGNQTVDCWYCHLYGCFSGLLACLLKSYARKHRVTFYPEARFSDKTVKPTLREYLWMPDWKVASYAGIDAVAYLHSVVYCVLQLLTFLPFLFFGVPFYYRGGDTASTFDRFTISNLHLLDTTPVSPIHLCTLIRCEYQYLAWEEWRPSHMCVFDLH